MGVTHSRQKRGKTFLLDFSVDGRTAIRFFYNPVGNYFHFPLIFRAVEPGDDIGQVLVTGGVNGSGGVVMRRSSSNSLEFHQFLPRTLTRESSS